MKAEEIYDKACEFAEERINEGMLYDIRTEIRFSFERGAEWALEQMHAVIAESYERGVAHGKEIGEEEADNDSVRVTAC